MRLDIPVELTRYRLVNQQTGEELPETHVKEGHIDLTFVPDDQRQVLYMQFNNLPIPPTPLFIIAEYQNYKKAPDQEDFIQQKLSKIFKGDSSKFLQALVPRTLDSDPDGPGTILSNMLSAMGIKSKPNCSCKKRAIYMNKMGNEWCEQNIGTILEWLKEEATKRKLPFIRSVAKMMVNKAISKSKRLLAKNEST